MTGLTIKHCLIGKRRVKRYSVGTKKGGDHDEDVRISFGGSQKKLWPYTKAGGGKTVHHHAGDQLLGKREFCPGHREDSRDSIFIRRHDRLAALRERAV